MSPRQSCGPALAESGLEHGRWLPVSDPRRRDGKSQAATPPPMRLPERCPVASPAGARPPVRATLAKESLDEAALRPPALRQDGDSRVAERRVWADPRQGWRRHARRWQPNLLPRQRQRIKDCVSPQLRTRLGGRFGPRLSRGCKRSSMRCGSRRWRSSWWRTWIGSRGGNSSVYRREVGCGSIRAFVKLAFDAHRGPFGARFVLADQVGLGKTLQLAMAIVLPPFLQDAYSQAEAFCRPLANRLNAGFFRTMLLRRIVSTMAAGRLTPPEC